MGIYGKIKKFKVVTLDDDLNALNPDEKSIAGYVKNKHETAEREGRYIVSIMVSDPRFKDDSKVNVFLPKGIIDNNLIDVNTVIECDSDNCHLKIIGVDDWFSRAANGMTEIHDKRHKLNTSAPLKVK